MLIRRLVALTLFGVLAITVAHAHASPVASPDGATREGIVVERWVEIPDRSGGLRPRLNHMAFAGDRIFVVEEADAILYEILPTEPPSVTVTLDIGSAVSSATSRSVDRTNSFHGGPAPSRSTRSSPPTACSTPR